MTGVPQLPIEALWVATFGVPLLVFLGVALGHWLTRRGAKELETRSRREQLLKVLQWAAELAVSEDEVKADLGVNMLLALAASELRDPAIDDLVDAALETVVGPVADQIDENPDAEIVGDADDAPRIGPAADTASAPSPINSRQEPDRKGDAQ